MQEIKISENELSYGHCRPALDSLLVNTTNKPEAVVKGCSFANTTAAYLSREVGPRMSNFHSVSLCENVSEQNSSTVFVIMQSSGTGLPNRGIMLEYLQG